MDSRKKTKSSSYGFQINNNESSKCQEGRAMETKSSNVIGDAKERGGRRPMREHSRLEGGCECAENEKTEGIRQRRELMNGRRIFRLEKQFSDLKNNSPT